MTVFSVTFAVEDFGSLGTAFVSTDDSGVAEAVGALLAVFLFVLFFLEVAPATVFFVVFPDVALVFFLVVAPAVFVFLVVFFLDVFVFLAVFFLAVFFLAVLAFFFVVCVRPDLVDVPPEPDAGASPSLPDLPVLFVEVFGVVFFGSSTEADDDLRGRVANSHPHEQETGSAPSRPVVVISEATLRLVSQVNTSGQSCACPHLLQVHPEQRAFYECR